MPRQPCEPCEPLTRERCERVARIYATTNDAALVLDTTPAALRRAFRRHHIATPQQRRKSV